MSQSDDARLPQWVSMRPPAGLVACALGAWMLAACGCSQTRPPRPSPAAPTTAPAERERRVFYGDGFGVWCDADGNARMVTDGWGWVQLPLPDNKMRRVFSLVRTMVPQPAGFWEARAHRDGLDVFVALTVLEELPASLAKALRETAPGPRRNTFLAVSKRLLATKGPLRSAGLLIPYELLPAGRQALETAVRAATQPSTKPAE